MPDSRAPALFASLSKEHGLIARCLHALDVLAGRLEGEGADGVLMGDLQGFVTFLNEFGELVHHVKEEDVLLPYLVRHGMSWDTGPISRIRADHDQERYLLRVLEQATNQEGHFSREDRRHAVATVRGFVEFLRGHIDKEDGILMPAIADRLTPQAIGELEDALTAFDRERCGLESYDQSVRAVEALIAKYEPPESVPADDGR
jgi:hemerythrin-like domain-containing protein